MSHRHTPLVALLSALSLVACTAPVEPGCPTGQTDCGGTCIDLKTDRAHCGTCETACEAGHVCDGNGQCALSCQASLLACDGTCTDPQTSRTHCGATDTCTGEKSGATCAAGELCVAGRCTPTCPGTQVACDGACIDPATNPAFCGASGDCSGANAGTPCADGFACVAGQCASTCVEGTVNCGGTCIDPASDPDHCGAGSDCTATPGATCGDAPNAAPVCSAGACAIVCLAGYDDCDGVATNGCETKGICSGACTFRDAEHPNYTTPAQDVALCGAMYDATNINEACTPAFHVCRLAEWQARFPPNASPGGTLTTFGMAQASRCNDRSWEANRPENGDVWNQDMCASAGESNLPYNPWNDGKFLLADDGTTILQGSGDCCDWDETFEPTQETTGFAVYCCRD